MFELTAELTSIFLKLWYFIPILLFIALLKSNWFKGFFGEVFVNILLRLCLDKKSYHLIKNVTLPTEDGTTQVDHIVVSKHGIFVIETKNMKGWIFGSEKQRQWTQKIYKHSYEFQNPLHQNYKHTKTLANALQLADESIVSIIVFVGDAVFKTPMPDNVLYVSKLIGFIKSKQNSVFSEKEVRRLVNSIESGRLQPSLRTHREHVQHVKSIQANAALEKICPKCGSAMIERIAKKGSNVGNMFWGCSRFPKCRFTSS